MQTPFVLVIIVTWNKKEYVINLLTSLKKIEYPKDRMDILVVDNASSDGSKEAVAHSFQDVKIICNTENFGGSGGFNTGLKWAFQNKRYDYLWLLDNDVVVHQDALYELVSLLEEQKDTGVAGSAVMQLEYPWRMNELGGFVDPCSGRLIFNRKGTEIDGWKGKKVDDLIVAETGSVIQAVGPRSFYEVDYAAAASLVVRADVAEKAGLWMDFFLHYDDVEWCLRIKKMGLRILAAPRSLVWHLSPHAKAPTWIHYYDNRNPLYMFQRSCESVYSQKLHIRRILLKGLRFALVGRPELAQLHIDAIDDFSKEIMGKKHIELFPAYTSAEQLQRMLSPHWKRILIPWTVWNSPNAETVQLVHEILKKNAGADVTLLGCLGMPFETFTEKTPVNKIAVLPSSAVMISFAYLKMFQRYDLVFQSDGAPLAGPAFCSRNAVFLNGHEGVLKKRDWFKELSFFGRELVRRWF